MAARTGLRRVGRWNENEGNACKSRFVVDEHPQLVKRPVVGSATFLFSAGLLVERFSNIRQVLKRQCCTQLFCLVYQLLTDIVVDPFLEPTFSAREPSQELSTAPSAFARDVGSYPTVSITSWLQLRAVPRLPSRGCGNVTSAQINTNYLGSLPVWWGIQFNGDVDVETSISPQNQSGTGGRLPVKQGALVVANQQLEPMTLVYQGNPNFLGVWVIDKRSSIQADASWAKRMNLLGCLQIAQYATNRLTDVIRLQSRCFPNCFINQVMQFCGVVALMQLSGYQDSVASIRKSLHRAVNCWSHIVGDLELTRYRQGLSHASILLHQSRKTGKTDELRTLWREKWY